MISFKNPLNDFHSVKLCLARQLGIPRLAETDKYAILSKWLLLPAERVGLCFLWCHSLAGVLSPISPRTSCGRRCETPALEHVVPRQMFNDWWGQKIRSFDNLLWLSSTRPPTHTQRQQHFINHLSHRSFHWPVSCWVTQASCFSCPAWKHLGALTDGWKLTVWPQLYSENILHRRPF